MKLKLTFLLISFFITSISFAQLENTELSDIITIDATQYTSESNALTVPTGKFWVLNSYGEFAVYFKMKGGGSYVPGQFLSSTETSNIPLLYTEGMSLYFEDIDPGNISWMQILEYKSPSGFDGTLAIEETTLPKEKLILFPNPTDSQLTINSDKIFKVEVYDLMGRKMFETNSTSIDFTELKTGIYLVNLYDEGDKIVSTYKVVKN